MKIEIEIKDYALLVESLFAYESYLKNRIHLYHNEKAIKTLQYTLSRVSEGTSQAKKQAEILQKRIDGKN